MNIQDKLRAGSVKRFHIVETTKTQSIAEHSFNVAMIAGAIGALLGWDLSPVYRDALFHDIPEVMTGDLPHLFKKELKKRVDFDEIEDYFMEDEKVWMHDEVKIIIKMADIMEATWFISEWGVGRHAAQVAKLCRDQLNETMKKMPKSERTAAREVWLQIEEGEFTLA